MVTKSRYRNASRRLINTALENMIFAEILLEYFCYFLAQVCIVLKEKLKFHITVPKTGTS